MEAPIFKNRVLVRDTVLQLTKCSFAWTSEHCFPWQPIPILVQWAKGHVLNYYRAQNDYTHIFIVWQWISQLRRTSVAFLVGMTLCNPPAPNTAPSRNDKYTPKTSLLYFQLLRDSETTIKIKFAVWRGGGRIGGREENRPKRSYLWETPRQ